MLWAWKRVASLHPEVLIRVAADWLGNLQGACHGDAYNNAALAIWPLLYGQLEDVVSRVVNPAPFIDTRIHSRKNNW